MSRIVIVGGGFAGVWAALAAARARREHDVAPANLGISLVTRDPWLTIRPRLYEASLEGTRVSLEAVLRPAGVELIIGDVARIDREGRMAVLNGPGGRRLPYDRLVLATGSAAVRPPIPGAELAFSVDTFADAVALGRHVAALPASAGDGRYSAVVIGAGFTGIEVATALVSRLREVALPGHATRVVVVERAAHVAPDLGLDARDHVTRALDQLGVELRTGVSVAEIARNGVRLDDGECIPAATTIWTGGFRASPLASQLGGAVDTAGRVEVNRWLEVTGAPGMYVAGDAAHAIADAREGQSYVAPMSCQCAIPMGDVAGYNAAADLLGAARREFTHADYVTCLDLGEAGALFMEGWDRAVRLSGFWGKLMKEMINTRLIYPSVVIPSGARDPHIVGRSADPSLRSG